MSKAIAEDWYTVRRFSDDVSLITERWVASWLRCNIWHIRGKTHDLLVDSGMGVRPLKAEVAAAALAAGAHLINDVNGLRDPAMLQVCAAAGAPATSSSETLRAACRGRSC